MPDTIVHTLEARDNFLLAFLQDRFALDGEDVRRVIVDSVERTAAALSVRGIDYAALGPALTPRANRRELGLFFDAARIDATWYGRAVHQALLPLLASEGSHSVLHGDLLGNPALIAGFLSSRMHPAGRVLASSGRAEYYCVYVNNCSDAMVDTIHEGLIGRIGYIGYVDLTYTSDFRTYLSTVLNSGYIQFRRTIIQSHEDDAPEEANQDTLGFGFARAGFECRSVAHSYFGLLLSYKIERPVLFGDEKDQLLSLNAVSHKPEDISQCDIEIDDRKLGYLAAKKSGSMKRLGVLGFPGRTIAEVIRAKLSSNYLYNMRFRPGCNVASFNILLELEAVDSGEPVRTVAAFAYEPERSAIRLITMF